jgi:hypothetical protein
VLALSLDHDDGGKVTRVVEAPPRPHVRHRIGTEQQVQRPVWGCERLERVGGHGCLVAVDLDRAGLDAFDVGDCGGDESVAVARRCDDLPALLPGISRDDEQHAIEPHRGSGIGRRDEMADVNRVEGAPEDADALGTTGRPRLRTGLHSPTLRRTSTRAARAVHDLATLLKPPDTYPSPVGDETFATHVLVRVWLPDRPGALGLVAARIGSVGGDIVGVDVLERSEGVAVDEFAVVLADLDVLELLAREIEQVDGTSVEEFRVVGAFPDPRLDALESAATLCEVTSAPELPKVLVAHLRREFLADWAALLLGGEVVARAGDSLPTTEFLSALAAGTAASPKVVDGTTGPDDLLVAGLPGHGATVLVGRDGHPFRRRERVQLLALARIADRAWELLT